MIHDCTCHHPGQDALHGPGKRVYNPKADGSHECTVKGCGNVYRTGALDKYAAKKAAKKAAKAA